MKKSVLITGGGGQLASELINIKPSHFEALVYSSDEMDVTDENSVNNLLDDILPFVVINCAAYTAVDRAEDEKDVAFRVNRDGVALLARACRSRRIKLIHISTDFVFDGSKSRPYRTDDEPAPLSVYGKSKYEGERELFSCYREGSVIVRTAWLYSAFGSNFVKTMLKLFSGRDEVRVVDDQIGTPTWAANLASFLWFVVDNFDDVKGKILHFTDLGIASWYDFAVAIEEESRKWRGNKIVEVIPITTDEFPQKAVRPCYSVLDKTDTWKIWGKTSDYWRVSLRKMLEQFYGGVSL